MKLKAGETVYTILRHVSNSGMFRVIDLVVIRHNKPFNIFPFLTEEQHQQLLKHYKIDKKREGFRVSGCNMNMGFSLVYNLSGIVFEKFKCTGDTCPSNDHVNDRKPYQYKNKKGNIKGKLHSDGGYALKQSWL